ncbi:MAG: CDP-alcohol phosphatidyltransferase family protein [Gemmatimonadota bacterium]
MRLPLLSSTMEQQVESTPRRGVEQGRSGFTTADFITVVRLPLALAFIALPGAWWRLAVLSLAAATDLLDGILARRFGGSRFGAVLDPIADKLFMACAFGVVLLSRRLQWYEIVGVLLRDLWATAAFVVTLVTGRATAIPARVGGKAVTVGQMLTLLAFIASSPILRPLAWATGAIAIYAIWDYNKVARIAGRRL